MGRPDRAPGQTAEAPPLQDAGGGGENAGAEAITGGAEHGERQRAAGNGEKPVEVDPETGSVDIVRYSAVDDVGRAVNPMIVHGVALPFEGSCSISVQTNGSLWVQTTINAH
jgi:hypothetical protein